MFPSWAAAATLLLHPTISPQLHLQAQLYSPGAVGYWVRESRGKHPTDHSSQQTPVPGAPERTKGRHVSVQPERKGVSAKSRLCTNHGGMVQGGQTHQTATPQAPSRGRAGSRGSRMSASTQQVTWSGLQSLCFWRLYPALGSRLAGQESGKQLDWWFSTCNLSFFQFPVSSGKLPAVG